MSYLPSFNVSLPQDQPTSHLEAGDSSFSDYEVRSSWFVVEGVWVGTELFLGQIAECRGIGEKLAAQFVEFGGQVFNDNYTQGLGTEGFFQSGKVDIVLRAVLAIRDVPKRSLELMIRTFAKVLQPYGDSGLVNGVIRASHDDVNIVVLTRALLFLSSGKCK